MKKLAKIVAIAAACAALTGSVAAFSACGDSYDLTVSGSSSVTPLMQELAAKYEDETGIRIQIQQSDSGTGISDAQQGLNDFGMASRDVKDTEKGVTSVKIATDGVALIVNEANTTVSNVTSAELYELYANGTAFQGISAGITREEGSGTRDAFGDLIKDSTGEKKLKDLKTLAKCITTQNSTGNVMTAIQSDTKGNTIGYISMGSVAEAKTKKCKTVNFAGVEPTSANVRRGVYKLPRSSNLVCNTETGLSDVAKGFISWILSEEGQKIVVEKGYIELTDAELTASEGVLK